MSTFSRGRPQASLRVLFLSPKDAWLHSILSLALALTTLPPFKSDLLGPSTPAPYSHVHHVCGQDPPAFAAVLWALHLPRLPVGWERGCNMRVSVFRILELTLCIDLADARACPCLPQPTP